MNVAEMGRGHSTIGNVGHHPIQTVDNQMRNTPFADAKVREGGMII